MRKSDTINIIESIVNSNPDIQGIYIHEFPDSKSLQDRLVFNEIEKKHFANALKLRDRSNVPFWDSLLLSFYNSEQYSLRILESVLRSHAKRKKVFISRDQVLSGELYDFSDSDKNYAINSEFLTSEGKKKHLLLLDFHIPESNENAVIVSEVLNILGADGGYLLNSGRSYHFIGTGIMSSHSMLSFLGKCLFFTPIIDKTWIAHQIVDRSCSLRITKKNGKLPTLISKIN